MPMRLPLPARAWTDVTKAKLPKLSLNWELLRTSSFDPGQQTTNLRKNESDETEPWVFQIADVVII